MAPSHSHGASGRDGHAHTRGLAVTLGLVLLYMAAEVAGGLWSGSLALLADAGHMLSDAGALTLTLFAFRIAQRPPTAAHTYGYYRAEILAALVNGAALVAIAILIVVEAWERFREPRPIRGELMMAVALGGLLVNGASLWLLRGGHEADLNVRGAWLHVMSDALGSVQAIAAGALILWFGWTWADPLASVLIAALVVYASWSLIRQSIDVLMEGTPPHIDIDEVRAALLALPRVTGVHDLHVWSISSGFVALSVHIRSETPAEDDAVLKAAQETLSARFGIRHLTIQIDRDETCGRAEHPHG